MVTILPSEDCVFRLDSRYGFNHAANLPVTYTDVTLDDRGFGFNGSSSFIKCSALNIDNESEITVLIIYNDLNAASLSTMLETSTNFNSHNGAFIISKDANEIISGVRVNGATAARKNATTLISNRFYSSMFIINPNAAIGLKHTIYTNGTLDSGTVTANTSFTSNFITYDLYVGSRAGSSLFFNGYIKHISIYNYALTAQEVADQYNKCTFGGHL